MKKNILKVMIIMLALFSTSVKAESYYTNDNGLEFTEFQYNTLVNILNENDVKKLTQEEYNYFEVDKMVEGNYEYTIEEFETYDFPANGGLMPYASHETTAKKLILSKTCSGSYCTMTTTVTWKKTPAVTSYDVIGVRLVNTTFYDSLNDFTAKFGSTVKTMYDGSKKTSNGLADAIKISSNVDYITFKCRVNKTSNGVVYASYQHAVKTVTLTQALNFTFSGSGYGGVFAWPSSYGEIYDQMGGVKETLY